MAAQDTTPGKSRLDTRMYPHHATSTVTQAVIEQARRVVLVNSQGDTRAEKTTDARELMDMLGLTDPGDLLKPVTVRGHSAMGGTS